MMDQKRMGARRLLAALLALCSIVCVLLVRSLFWRSGTETLGRAEVFDSYIRYRDGIRSYVGRDAFSGLPEDGFSEFITKDGAMRITISSVGCEVPAENEWRGADGWYFLEAWFDWLEIPAVRGSDDIGLNMTDAAYAYDGYSFLCRYRLKGDPTEYIAVYEGNLYGQDFLLPEGDLESLQIYICSYMCVSMPERAGVHSVRAQYRHQWDTSDATGRSVEYYHFHNTIYDPTSGGQ